MKWRGEPGLDGGAFLAQVRRARDGESAAYSAPPGRLGQTRLRCSWAWRRKGRGQDKRYRAPCKTINPEVDGCAGPLLSGLVLLLRTLKVLYAICLIYYRTGTRQKPLSSQPDQRFLAFRWLPRISRQGHGSDRPRYLTNLAAEHPSEPHGGCVLQHPTAMALRGRSIDHSSRRETGQGEPHGRTDRIAGRINP